MNESPEGDLVAERDALLARAVEAEALAEQLAEQLAEARRQLARRPIDPDDAQHLTLFDDAPPAAARGHFAADGSDRAVLSIALAATAVVALLVCVLALVTSGVSIFALVMLGLAAVLGWAALQTRVTPVTVEVRDGVVVVTARDDTKRFDLTNDGVRVEVQGRPGDAYWRVRFHRRALDPVDVDASMVDAATFMRRLREYRPEL
ncbi:hypothetical protein ABFT23_11905 [Nocardioides sp. C4-1]|uniref:hypothetical protein n=1 Tax=Nocardioides sp. C4-1 TaxID=3151851 RepID=UPI00326304A8